MQQLFQPDVVVHSHNPSTQDLDYDYEARMIYI